VSGTPIVDNIPGGCLRQGHVAHVDLDLCHDLSGGRRRGGRSGLSRGHCRGHLPVCDLAEVRQVPGDVITAPHSGDAQLTELRGRAFPFGMIPVSHQQDMVEPDLPVPDVRLGGLAYRSLERGDAGPGEASLGALG
jgi:hypothetical protein